MLEKQNEYKKQIGKGWTSWTSQTEPTEFILHLKALPSWPTTPVQRLKLALKHLLRARGLKAVSVKPAKPVGAVEPLTEPQPAGTIDRFSDELWKFNQ